jgi:hypothetical protein
MRRLGASAVAVALAIGVGACAEAKYRYIVSGSEDVSFKVPSDWTTYSLPTGADDRIAPDSPGDVQLIWSSGFDADPNADVEHLKAMTDFGQVLVLHPVGVANVYQIQGSYNQKVSLTEARKAALGVDPLYVSDDVRSLVEVIEYKPLTRFRGLQGTRVRFNLRVRADAPWSTYDLIALIDQNRYRMYTFIVGCIGTCFQDNQSALDEVVNSWRFEQ